MIINNDWGGQENYEDFRNRVIAYNEHDVLLTKYEAGEDVSQYLNTHYDGLVSIAIGYGFDLLVRGDGEINEYLSQIGLNLSLSDMNILNSARPIFSAYRDVEASSRSDDADLSVIINDELYEQGVEFDTETDNKVRYKLLMEHFSDNLDLSISNESDARSILAYHTEQKCEGKVTGIADSRERAAIMSLLYQVPNSPTLITIANSADSELKRVKLWAEIRYFNQSTLFRRRRESDIFSLYDNANAGGNSASGSLYADGNTAPPDINSALITVNYLLRGYRNGSVLFDSIDINRKTVQGFDTEIEKLLDYLSSELADGRSITAAFTLDANEGEFIADDISSSKKNDVNGGDLIFGSDSNDTINGGLGADVLLGNEGVDTLIGGNGEDLLDGGEDNDSMSGGQGNDTYIVDTAGDNVHEASGEGDKDLVKASVNYELTDNVEDLELTDSAKEGTGNDLDNTITGNDSQNTLDGGAGQDTLIGKGGNDTYIVDETGDSIQEDAGQGTDTVQASATYTLSSHVEELELVGDQAIDGTGNSQDNEITGNDRANTLTGVAGKNKLYGKKGADTLIGGSGKDTLDAGSDSDADTLKGGAGFDTYIVKNNDVISDSDGAGKVKFNGKYLTGGTRKEDDPENEYKGGGNTYILNGDTLVVNSALTINNFSKGDLRISLETEEEPEEPPEHNPNNTVVRRFDPLAFDLDGSGDIATVSLGDTTAFFDLDNDGIAERVGWINPQDGLLVRDLDQDGSITNRDELFGNAVVNGFTDLKQAGDSNNDDLFDENDPLFGELKVWQDVNQDGLSQSDELHTLAELGIESIDLLHEVVSKDSNGNRIIAEGSIVQNGESVYAAAFDLQLNNRITKDPGSHTLDQTVLQDLLERDIYLPLLRGFGSVKDLQSAYAESDALLAKVQYLAGADAETVYQNFEQVLAGWSGLTELRENAGLDITPALSTTEKLWIMESFSGISEFKGAIEQQYAANRSPFIGSLNGAYLNSRFEALSTHYANRFILQSTLSDSFRGATYSVSSNTLQVNDTGVVQSSLIDAVRNSTTRYDVALIAQVYSEFRTRMDLDETYMLNALGDSADAEIFASLLRGDVVDISIGRQQYTASDGNSYIIGTLSGNDTLLGRGGDDFLEGRAGDDTLQGGLGNDTYYFSAGDGIDFIYEEGSARDNDRILFGAGIGSEQVMPLRQGYDLVLHIGDVGQQVKVTGFFNEDATTGRAIDRIVFADATEWTIQDIKAKVIIPTAGRDSIWGYDSTADELFGLAGDDTIIGLAGDDSIQGQAGDDWLSGGDGDDHIAGGLGNDHLIGDQGNDIYAFELGDGHDVIEQTRHDDGVDKIQLGEGILAQNTQLVRENDDLVIHISDDQTIRVERFFYQDAQSGLAIDEVVFSDSTVWSTEYIKQQVLIPTEMGDRIWGYDSSADNLTGLGGDDEIRGMSGDDIIDAGSGDDTVYGGFGNDLLRGGAGNDYLQGNWGSDTFFFNLGDGADRVSDIAIGDDVNILQFGAGIVKDDITVRRNGEDLSLVHRNGIDSVTVTDYFRDNSQYSYELTYIRFNDGSEFTSQELKQRVLEATEGDDVIKGYAGNDLISGLAGHDKLYGKAGDDELQGGSGNDFLEGGSGNDLLFGEEGNDRLYAADGDDELQGGAGDDELQGSAGNDRLFGQDGDDELYGDSGTDHLSGGKGDDYLAGGAGDDFYYFTAGDGQDSIVDSEGLITIYVTDINLEDIILRRNGRNLDLQFKQIETDKITIQDYYPDVDAFAGRQIGFFIPGTSGSRIFTAAEIDSRALEATESADLIHGDAGNNQIDALAGNDELHGGKGDDDLLGNFGQDELFGDDGSDTLNGGVGDDALDGGDGDDVYFFRIGDGQDIINNDDLVGYDRVTFAEGVAPDSVAVSRQQNNLLLNYGDTDQVIVSDFFTAEGSAGYTINEVTFANDVVWDKTLLLEMALVGDNSDNLLVGYTTDDILVGSEGNDQLYGEAGKDRLEGGVGEDYLYGGEGEDILSGGADDDLLEGDEGDDSYRFSMGDGHDVIFDISGTDNIEFTDINADDVVLRRDGDNLELTVTSTGDSIVVRSQFSSLAGGISETAIDSIRFADDVEWGLSDIRARTLIGTAGADSIIGHAENDVIAGLAGDDVIWGRQGDDQINGGPGDDQLYGEQGNDRLEGAGGSDALYGGEGDDRLFGGGGSDSLDGGADNDLLDGGADNDVLAGGTGNDTLKGGEGNDTLNAGHGNDLVRGGDGDDIIDGGYGSDRLYGDAGADQLSGSGELYGGDGDDQLRGGGLLDGGAGNDTLNGWGADTLKGGEGDDTLIAYSSPWSDEASVLEGGQGNDRLYGSFGDDSYLFNPGDGEDLIIERRSDENYSNIPDSQDTLRFGEGFSSSDLSYTRHGDDMVISHSNGSDKITIRGWFTSTLTNHFKVNRFEFANGEVLTDSDLESQTVTYLTDGDDLQVHGYRDLSETIYLGAGDDQIWSREGDDELYGQSGNDYLDAGEGMDRLSGGDDNDQLIGGTGNDFLAGGAGDDAYDYSVGHGVDEIDNSHGGYDYIYFRDITTERLGFSRDGDDLIVKVDGDENQSVRVLNHFLSSDYEIDAVQPGVDGEFSISAARINQTVAAAEFEGQFDAVIDGDDTAQHNNTGNALAGTAGRDLIRGYGGDDQLFGFSGDDSLDGGEGNDYLSGGNGINANTGNDYLTGGTGNDTLRGEDGDDILFGNEGQDYLDGGEGKDSLFGGDGFDRLVGGKGNDFLKAGAGDDHYYYYAGNGVDTIDNSGGGTQDVLFFNDVEKSRLSFERSGDDLLVRIDGDDSQAVRVLKHFLGGEYAIDYIQPENGYLTGVAAIEELVTTVSDSQAPVLSGEQGDLLIDEDQRFTHTISSDLFDDPDLGDYLSYSVKLENGDDLPGWLSFDPLTRTLSGKPGNVHVGNIDLTIAVIDGAGNTATTDFSLTVNNVNDAPDVNAGIYDQSATEDSAFSFTIPEDAFSDADAGDSLTYSVVSADDSALPEWLSFDAVSRTLTGIPENADVGALELKVIATDSSNLSTSDTFMLAVSNTNDAPEIQAAIAEQSTLEDSPFSFTIPEDAFNDVDAGDALTYSIVLADGSALPEWLSFDSDSKTISGTPENADVGELELKVIATDSGDLSVSDTFTLTVRNTNDAPEVQTAIADQTAIEDSAFSFTISEDAFNDVDAGESLSYSVLLADESALPEWLNFDADSRTISGTPENMDVGSLELKIIATDSGNLIASDVFTLQVSNTNDVPLLESELADQNVTEDSAFTFTIPDGVFRELDPGDSLAYQVALAGGSDLPGWLSFNSDTLTLSGTPANTDVGDLELKVIATDDSNLSVSDTFKLIIENSNDGPEVYKGILNQNAIEDETFVFTIPDQAFADIDEGDALSYLALLADGGELPAWLSFNSLTGVFSGIPQNEDVGLLELEVVATDSGNQSTETDFTLIVANSNDAPIVVNALHDQQFKSGDPLSVVIPSDSFSDSDRADFLTYTVVLGDDSELPAWLSFDPETLTLSGTPPIDAPDLQLKVTATDSFGLFASDEFTIAIEAGTVEPQYNEIVGDNTSNILKGGDTADHISGKGGNDRLTAGLADDWLEGGKGNDTLYGNDGDDRLEGGAGADKLFGNNGNDLMIGGTGNDQMAGGSGDDTFQLVDGENGYDRILGQAGYDRLLGTDADDVIGLQELRAGQSLELIDGGAGVNVITGDHINNYLDFSATELRNISRIQGSRGNDTIIGSQGDDQIIGDEGNDKLSGGAGDDLFSVKNGDGFDQFKGGAGFDRVVATEGDDQIGIYLHTAQFGLELIDGGAGHNTIVGSAQNNRMDFSKTALINIAAIDAGAGKDFITGTHQGDVLIGGADSDRLYGGLGSDEYRFDAGDGQDTVYEHKGSAEGDLDRMVFTQADATDQLWFSRSNSDLLVDVVGSSDRVTVKNWYKAERYQIEQIEIDGAVVENESVDALVQAMAAFDVPSGVGGVISDEVKQQLQPVLAESWQAA